MKDFRTNERRLKDYYTNCLNQLVRIDEDVIPRWWELIRFKTERRTLDLSNQSTYRLLTFSLYLAIYCKIRVSDNIKNYLKPDEKKLLIGTSSLSFKDEEEGLKALISLFTSQEVHNEIRKIINNVWDGHIDVDDKEKATFERFQHDVSLFGHDYKCLLN